LPEGDMGCHPADEKDGAVSGTHNISFCCDDMEKTVEELKVKGVNLKSKVEDQGYGFVTYFLAPGDLWIQLYQPKY
jgi:predicted enzyme related to lactoylglutathione lyase